MSAHFDGGAEIAGRRLREVEVSYVDDPTLDMGAEDSDDCPASPPPTYYLRVREEKRASGGRRDGPNSGGGGGSSGSNNGFGKQSHGRGGAAVEGRRDGVGEENGGDRSGGDDYVDDLGRRRRKEKSTAASKGKAWSWRYVNVEKKALLVWDRRGGRLLRSVPLKQVESLLVSPDPDAPASILEVHISCPSTSSPPPLHGARRSSGNSGGNSGGDSSKGDASSNTGLASNRGNTNDDNDDDNDSVSGDDTSASGSGSGSGSGHDNEGAEHGESEGDAARRRQPRQDQKQREQLHQHLGGGEGGGDGTTVLVLQARSRRETLLWAKVLQENVELMTKRLVPLENRDEETNLSDVQQLAKLLTHQLSELQHSGSNQGRAGEHPAPSCGLAGAGKGSVGTTETIPEGVEGSAESC